MAIAGVSFGLNSKHVIPKDIATKGVLPAQTAKAPVSPTPEVTQGEATDPSEGVPQTLNIPKINVEASVESVGLDKSGRMDVPKNDEDVAWYQLGYKLGQKGNAVIDGHLDKVTGAPAVFWNIGKLRAGDKIIVTDKAGKTYKYGVVNVASYPYNNFPMQNVFGSSSKSMLNLITCTGTWDAANKNYSERTVVYSQLTE